MAYSIKKDGSLRVCIDPQKLNDVLKRNPHKIPTIEEINPKLAGAKVFSKLDAKSGYWSIPLSERRQLLTTFRTPFGRYCWLRLPFGLKVSQDIFQERMDDILGDLDGVVNISDDIFVFGATEAEHDANLARLMQRSVEHNIVFNIAKCEVKKPNITFFGNQYSADGIQPDPKKIQGIQDMPTPRTKEELHTFLGLMNDLTQFIPKFAEKAHDLRGLLKQDVNWVWEPSHQQQFDNLKAEISREVCLKYYDTKKPLTLEVDASQKGLGAALVQDGRPVAFGSKTLTDCQSRYSNIEREMLAVGWGVERYHQYLFGRDFTVVTDLKPLEVICKKSLRSAPARLQRMLMRIQDYDFTIQYRPGKDMVLADSLSRLPDPATRSDVHLDVKVEELEMGEVDKEYVSIALINFATEKQQKLREETNKDPMLRELMSVIHVGWPESISNLATDLRVFWSIRDELVLESGVICKGNRILIPAALRPDMLRQLHEGHQGVERTRQLARENVYWPNINKDIEQLCKTCEACQEHQPSNCRKPITAHETPSRPWRICRATYSTSEASNTYCL